MANMESVERAGSYFNKDIGTNASVSTQTKSDYSKVTTEKNQSTSKALNDTLERDQRSVQNPEKGKEKKEITPQQLKEAVEKANKQVKMAKTSLEFTYNEDVKRYSVKVKNKETDEVIREYPSEDALKALENIWRLAGIIVDESI